MLSEILTAMADHPIMILILLTLLPFLELRASIPYGILNTSLHWSVVFIICVTTNFFLGPLVYIGLDKFIHLILRINVVERLYNKTVARTQKNIERYVERWGELGVALFIGVPLPGSGSYSGAIGSYILGIRLKRFVYANLIGVVIAGILVTAIILTGSTIFSFAVKAI